MRTVLAIMWLSAVGCAAEPADPAPSETLSTTAALTAGLVPQVSASAAAAAVQGCRIQLNGYPTEWVLATDPSTSAPVTIRHPSGVNTIWMFGGTYFLKGMYASIGKTCLVMQDDGNFVIYDERQAPRWASNTFGRGAYAKFQVDGNLVVYDASNQPLRTGPVPSNTCCNSGWNLHAQEDGNVVIYAPGWSPRWATNTSH